MDNINEITLDDTESTVESGAVILKKSPARARSYCLTWNNYNEHDIIYLKSYSKDNCDEYAFQEEKGDSGTPHLQIALKFKNPKSFEALKKEFPKCHIEIARNWIAAKKYCQKIDSRVAVGVNEKTNKRPVKDPLDGKPLRPFQQYVMDIINREVDDRTIYWIYDIKGCSGKTCLAKHLCLTKPGETIYLTGKANDVKFGVFKFLENLENNLKVCLFDFPRSLESFVSYDAIESVKNGIFYNSKYEASMVTFDVPHIICFANFEPNRDALSHDRWKIIEIEDGEIKLDITDRAFEE